MNSLLPLYRAVRLSIVTVLSWLALSLPVNAQVTIQPKQVLPSQVGIIYNSETAMIFRAHPRGLAIGGYKGRIRTYYRTTFYGLEAGYIKHHKEVRQSNELAAIIRGEESPRPYVYGKQNNFFVIRGSYGVKRYFSEKARRKGLAVGVHMQAGPTLGLLKPYYLRLIERQENNVFKLVTERYTEEKRELFLDPYSIYGGTSLTKGLDQLQVIPGIHGMAAAHFAFGAFEEYVMAVDAGVMLDVFPRRVPIMVEDNQPYFLNLFLTLHIGKRK